MSDNEIQHIIDLVHSSALDETIKEILIRDLKSEGLTDFLKEQILAYCDDALAKLDATAAAAKKILEERGVQYDTQIPT